MNHNKCKCLKIEASEQEFVCIEIQKSVEDILLKMFPNRLLIETIPNIWYEFSSEGVSFYWDMDDTSDSRYNNIFDIMFVVEDYVVKKFRKLILHGGAILNGEEAIVFTQSRKSGKSTLLRALLNENNYEYVSDDILLYEKEKIAGLAMPIRVRDKLTDITIDTGEYVGEMIDETGEKRNIYVPRNRVHIGYSKIAAIILPQYVSDEVNQIIELSGFQKISRLITNIKEYCSMEDLFARISELSKAVPVYCLQYHDIEYAKKEIHKLWKK